MTEDRIVNIAGLECHVKPDQEIIDSGCAIVAVPVKLALQPFDEHYVLGTLAGFSCIVCGQDCILAPSGQSIYKHGKNPLVCMECIKSYAQPA